MIHNVRIGLENLEFCLKETRPKPNAWLVVLFLVLKRWKNNVTVGLPFLYSYQY